MTEVKSDGATRFNELTEADAQAELHSCLAVPRWIDEMVAGRPYASAADAITLGGARARTMTPAEVELALARHPRIGERASAQHDAAFSAREQSGMAQAGEDVAAAIRVGNVAYENKFGRVFLIRAAGREPAEMLVELQRRLASDDGAELSEVIEQLAQIAEGRLRVLLEESA